jgi:thiazole synthase
MKNLIIADTQFHSRLFIGTGKFSSNEQMQKAIVASGSELVTVALRRINMNEQEDDLLKHLNISQVQILPNTSGVRTAKEAIFAAELAREALETNWLKLEIHPDPKYLLPDGEETLKAAKELVKKGFKILPYVQADPILCRKLEDAGTSAVMPLGAPIGTNKGLLTLEFLKIIIEQSQIPVVVDAGLGTPSHASWAMETGADAVLVNTAIAVSKDPITMAKAFNMAVQAGRMAYTAKLAATGQTAQASSPLTAFLEEL